MILNANFSIAFKIAFLLPFCIYLFIISVHFLPLTAWLDVPVFSVHGDTTSLIKGLLEHM